MSFLPIATSGLRGPKSALLLVVLSLVLSGCSSVVSGVRSEPIKEDHSKRTFGTYVDDESIELKAKVNLKETDSGYKEGNINVKSYNGVVLLIGQISTVQLREQAAEIVSQLKNVRKVHNELTVGPSTSALSRINDSWLSTKVRSRLAVNDEVKTGPIKVITENAVVYLMGMVTRQQAEEVVEVVRRTGGIQKIVRVFEYLD